jgi:hypothetical protein
MLQRITCVQFRLRLLRALRAFVIFLSFITCITNLGAQSVPSLGGSSRPMIGTSGGLSLPPRSGSERQHLGPTGKPCVTVRGEGRAEFINPHIIEHVVVVGNSCSQNIKMRVCYYQSNRCIPLTITRYARTEAVLGIMPAVKEFRYEYWEEFQ